MANTLKFGNGQWATKVGSTLAYNDENGNFKPLPFDFTRASSATVVNKDGLIEIVGSGEPRIDFKDDSNGALLLEPTRSNLITYSKDYSQSEWTNISYTKDASITYNSASVSPDGTLGVYQYECTVSGTNSQLGAVRAISYGVAYSNSVYLRRITGSGIVKLRGVNNGEIDVTSELTSSWKRFEITQTSNSTNGRFYINALVYGDVIEVWGAQVEQGSYATSYIPTQGGIGTRTVEYSKILNQPILKATNKFTMFFDAPKFLEINSGVGSFDNIMLNLGATESAYSGGGLHIYNNAWYYFDGSVSTDIGICYNSLTDSKFAISYDGTSFHKYANGVKIGSIALSASMVNWDTFQTGVMADAGLDERSWNLKNLKLYNTALTDAELQALTS